MHIRSTRFLFAGTALWLAASPAFALDGNDLVKKLTAGFNLQEGDIAVGSIDVNGSTVTLKGMSVGKAGATPDARVKLGDVTLNGVEEDDAGGYTIEKASFQDINLTEDKTTLTAKDMYLTGLYIPGDVNGDTIDSLLTYEEGHSGPMTVSVEGKQVLGIRETSFSMERTEDDSTLSFDGTIDGVSVDLTTIDDPKSKETIESLGLTKIDGNISMVGSWEIDSGTISMTEYAFDFANIGRLNIEASVSGYTMQFLKSLRETTKAMEQTENKEAAQQAAGLAMLGLLQQLSFNSAKISFDDDGITKRSLNYAGKTQGVSGEQMAMMLKGMAPLMMAQLNMPALQNSVSAAINTFLNNPRNFTIAAEPKAPVPLPMIIGAAQAAPNTLPDMLGVSVAANR
ncbi:hypothetical protein ACFSE1_00560 [Rhizobium helianthi]|uniref:DUF945 domain-containing protein n=1 Tax=Rhizobium helianthi TaxID=1132695 RepID=A0ABW4LXR8_9HYPH